MTPTHPLDHHPSFRAVLAAVPPLARLATELCDQDLVTRLALACGDLSDGFAAPPDSGRRRRAHHRAWIAVREIDRTVAAALRHHRVAPEIAVRAQRAIDRADVLIGALLPGVA